MILDTDGLNICKAHSEKMSNCRAERVDKKRVSRCGRLLDMNL